MKLKNIDLINFHITKSGIYRNNKTGERYKLVGPCKHCKEMFLKQPYSKGIYCSKNCKAKDEDQSNLVHGSGKDNPMYGKKRPDASKRMKEHNPTGCGPLNPNWKGGITSERGKIYNSPEYKNWRNHIFERDDYTCALCDEKGKKLEAHHIKKFSEYKELRFDVNNGITLCLKCHRGTKGKEKVFYKLFTSMINNGIV